MDKTELDGKNRHVSLQLFLSFLVFLWPWSLTVWPHFAQNCRSLHNISNSIQTTIIYCSIVTKGHKSRVLYHIMSRFGVRIIQETCLKLFQNYFRALLQLMNISQSMSTYSRPTFSSSTWKRGGVWICKLGVISQERLKIKVKLLLSDNRKWYMPRRLTQQRMTLSDLEWPHCVLSLW